MANYHQIKNAAILTPTGSTDLGSDANRYSNVFMSGNIMMSNGVTVTSTNVITPKIASVSYPGNDTAADIAGGQTITITGTGFFAGASVLLGTTPSTVVTVVSSTSITFTSPVLSAGNYALYVINSDGGTAIYIPGIAYSGTPTWSTSSGNIASVYETNSISSTVAATGDATISYSLNSGTLPTGSTLNSSTGLISGTAPASAGSTTYSFSIRATDGQNQDTDRSFTITVNTDAVSWSSPADNTSTALEQGAAMSTVTLSATSAAGKSITYTANALPTGVSISTNTIVGTPTVVGSTNSLITATAASSGRTATRTLNWVVSVASDTYWMYTTLLLNGEGAAASNNANNASFVDSSASAIAITRSGSLYQGSWSPFSASSWSNYFDGTGDYLTAPANAAWNFTGDWTFECWVYPTAITGYHTFLGQWGAPDNVFIWKMNSSGRMYLENLSTALTATSTTIVANQWQHIALTRSSNTIRMFVDGVLDATTATRSGTYYSSGAMYVGAGYGEVFNGYISNMRVLKGTALYTTAFTPSTTPLTAIANTSLLTCQSNRLIDTSTNAFAITRNGDTYVTKFTPFNGTTVYDPAIHGGSTVFTTNTDMLTMPTNAAFDFGTGDFTFEFWMWQPTYVASAEGAFLSGSASGSSDFVWYQNTFRFGRNSVAWDTTSSSLSPLDTPRQWYHIAFVKTSGTAKIFVNGVAVASAANSNAYGSQGGTVYIGRSSDGSRGFVGMMSNIRIVKGTAVYTSNFTPPTSAPTAISGTTFLLNGTNGGIIDQTGMNNLTTVGDAKISTAVKKYNSSSILFDGAGDYLTIAGSPLFAFDTGNFTIETWIYPVAVGTGSYQYPVLFSCGGTDGSTTGQFSMYLAHPAGQNVFYYFNGSASALTSGGTNPSTGAWSHVALVRTSGTMKYFVNGTQQWSTAISVIMGNNTDVNTFGIRTGNTGQCAFNGYMDDIRVTKGYARYTTTFTAPTSALITK